MHPKGQNKGTEFRTQVGQNLGKWPNVNNQGRVEGLELD